MYVVIAGLSNLGKKLAALLSQEGNEVVVIDLDGAKCAEMAECSDVMVITGDATHKSTLEEARVRNADALVAATGDDSHNLMISMIAKEIGVRTVISVVDDVARTETFKQAGVRFQVQPDAVVAKHIYRMISQPYVKDFLSVETGEIFEIEIEEGMKCVGRKVSEIGTPNGIKILVTEREGKYLDEDAKMEPKDWLTLIVNRESAKKGVEFMNKWFTKG
jgi:trk system potassium uptake protein TrkA